MSLHLIVLSGHPLASCDRRLSNACQLQLHAMYCRIKLLIYADVTMENNVGDGISHSAEEAEGVLLTLYAIMNINY